MSTAISRNEFLKVAGLGAASLAMPRPLVAREGGPVFTLRANVAPHRAVSSEAIATGEWDIWRV